MTPANPATPEVPTQGTGPTTPPAPQTPAPQPRALRRDAQENRQRLLQAARTVFAEHGLDAGVEDVAQAAGVGIGTLYRRFPTKDALVAELVSELLQEVLTLAREAERVPDGHGLEQFCYAMGQAQTTNRGCLARIWSDEQSTVLREQYRASLATLLADAQAHATIRPDAVVTDLDLLFWSLRGIIESTGDVSSTAWRRQVAITLAGLRPGSEALSEAAITDDLVTRARAAALQS